MPGYSAGREAVGVCILPHTANAIIRETLRLTRTDFGQSKNDTEGGSLHNCLFREPPSAEPSALTAADNPPGLPATTLMAILAGMLDLCYTLQSRRQSSRAGSVGDRPEHWFCGLARSETGQSIGPADWLGRRPARASASVLRAGSVGDRPEHWFCGLARSETGQSIGSAGWLGRRPARALVLRAGSVGDRPEHWFCGLARSETGQSANSV